MIYLMVVPRQTIACLTSALRQLVPSNLHNCIPRILLLDSARMPSFLTPHQRKLKTTNHRFGSGGQFSYALLHTIPWQEEFIGAECLDLIHFSGFSIRIIYEQPRAQIPTIDHWQRVHHGLTPVRPCSWRQGKRSGKTVHFFTRLMSYCAKRSGPPSIKPARLEYLNSLTFCPPCSPINSWLSFSFSSSFALFA